MDSPAAASGLHAGTGRPLSAEDFVVLNDEIRAFVRAGIPLDIGLRGTADRSRGTLRRVSERLAQQLESGVSLDAAIGAEQTRLPAEYRSVLIAGLRTGRLDEVLMSLSELSQATTSLRRQLRLSLIYPVLIFLIAFGLFVSFVLYLVPQLQRTYTLFELEPTGWVSLLQWLHRTASVWAIAVPVALVGFLVFSVVLRRTTGVSLLSRWAPGGWDLSLARFARVLSLLVRHDVPFPEGCRLSGLASGDNRLQHASEQLAASVESGRPMTEVLAETKRLPAFFRWLMAIGQQQGTLADSLRQAAEIHEQRALAKLSWFRRIVPPLIVVVCCGTITLLYGLTLFLPLTQLVKELGAG